jgi:hypothetical protein
VICERPTTPANLAFSKNKMLVADRLIAFGRVMESVFRTDEDPVA